MTYWMNGKIWSVPQKGDSVKKLDWLAFPLPCTGAYTEGIRMTRYNEKRVRCQDLPLWVLMRGTRPIRLRHKAMLSGKRSMLVVVPCCDTCYKHHIMPLEE